MATSTLTADWLSIRDVALRCNVSCLHVFTVMPGGRLHGVRTRLGWLIVPASAQPYGAERATQKAAAELRGRTDV